LILTASDTGLFIVSFNADIESVLLVEDDEFSKRLFNLQGISGNGDNGSAATGRSDRNPARRRCGDLW
jgi:hypothetical protein